MMYIYGIYVCVQFASILFSIFYSSSLEILACSLFFFTGFGIRVILALQKEFSSVSIFKILQGLRRALP